LREPIGVSEAAIIQDLVRGLSREEVRRGQASGKRCKDTQRDGATCEERDAGKERCASEEREHATQACSE